MKNDWQKKRCEQRSRPVPSGWIPKVAITEVKGPWYGNRTRTSILLFPKSALSDDERWERLNSLIAVVS